MKNYIRDKRSPIPKNENVSKVMSANKAKNTKPELALRKALWQNNIRGYRLHPKNIPGKPDISFISKKLAVFINGCFWHRCPHCDLPMPKSNQEFWSEKFNKNIIRDKNKIAELEKMDWQVITVWECEIKENIDILIKKIEDKLINRFGSN